MIYFSWSEDFQIKTWLWFWMKSNNIGNHLWNQVSQWILTSLSTKFYTFWTSRFPSLTGTATPIMWITVTSYHQDRIGLIILFFPPYPRWIWHYMLELNIPFRIVVKAENECKGSVVLHYIFHPVSTICLATWS